jgi:hypothetical protein
VNELNHFQRTRQLRFADLDAGWVFIDSDVHSPIEFSFSVFAGNPACQHNDIRSLYDMSAP